MFISFPSNVPVNDANRRDQVIRYLDLAAYHYLNHPDSVKEFYFVLIIDSEKPPWVLTRYRYNQNLIKGLTSQGLFKPPKRHRLVPWYWSRKSHNIYIEISD